MTRLKDKFDGFVREPSPAVWEKISDSLDGSTGLFIGQNRSKKRIWYYFAAACVLFGLVLGYNYLQSDRAFDDTKTIVNETKQNNELKESVQLSKESVNAVGNLAIDNLDKELKESTANDEFNYLNDGQNEAITENNSNKAEESKILNGQVDVTQKNKAQKIRKSDGRENTLAQGKENSINDGNDLAENNAYNNQAESNQNELTNQEAQKGTNHVDNTSNQGGFDGINESVIDNTLSDNPGQENIDGSNNSEVYKNDLSNLNNTQDGNNSSDGSQIDNTTPLTDPSFLSIAMIEAIPNEAEYKSINGLKNIEVKKMAFWDIGLSVKQSVIDYNANSTVNYSLASDVTLETVLNDVVVDHNNSRPLWLDLSLSKKLNHKVGLSLSLEYGQMTNTLSVQDEIRFENKNKNYALGMGMIYDLLKKNRLSLTTGISMYVGLNVENWIQRSSDNANVQSITTSGFNLDESTLPRNFNLYKTSNIFTNGEIDLNIKYHLGENMAIQFGPFVKRNFSAEYPGSDNYSKPFHWGFSSGLVF